MLNLLLAAAALQSPADAVPAQSAVDAERAFAVNAQRHGQWTAFRMYADPDAVMFTPQVVWAHEFLKGRQDPPASVQWWPAQSYVSCDGRMAVNTGPWVRDGGKSVGYFTTVWLHEKQQWQWVYDAGDTLQSARPIPKTPFVRKASCQGRPGRAPLLSLTPPSKRPGQGAPDDYGIGRSADSTLAWDWKVDPKGARKFRTFLWNGAHYEQVVYDETKPE
ncbi:MAG TPA: hypothetical protein VMN38_09885 [Sphingomicrobium sp.]|nr:hypothetical protein [Sphingomicrobium sp.]